MSHSLQSYLQRLIPMSNGTADQIEGYFKHEVISRNSSIISPGQTSRKSYFLKEGIIRSYIIDIKGNEVTTRIYCAPDFLNDFQSFFKKEPSKEYLETITDCEVQTLDFQSAQECFHGIPEFREWGRMMLTMNYSVLHSNMIDFHTETAEERYLKLMTDYPEIIQKVPLKIVASYLGITDSSLSRIRKKLSNQ